MRKQGSCLDKEIMQGTMPGARRRGRPRTAWMDNIKTWTGLPVEESIRITEINGESTSVVWPSLGSRTAKEQDRTVCDCDCAQPCIRQHSRSFSPDLLMLLCCVHSVLITASGYQTLGRGRTQREDDDEWDGCLQRHTAGLRAANTARH